MFILSLFVLHIAEFNDLFLNDRWMAETLSRESVNEAKLQELRFKYNDLYSIIDVTDYFFRYPVGMILATELLRVCEHIYSMIVLPSCPVVNVAYIVKNILLIGGVLIPAAYLHNHVSMRMGT